MRSLTAIAGILLAAALGGCQMLDSAWLETDPRYAGTTCHSNAGTYHLPRRLITVSVTGTDQTGFALTVDKESADGAPYVADRNETYCLDFLLSYLSADRVAIQRNADGLLQRIFTQADDKTKQIAQDVFQAAADLVASDRATLGRSATRPQFKPIKDKPSALATFQFDPFVEREAREVNYALAEFGYCIFLDANNDAFVPRWSRQICEEIITGVSRKSRVPGAEFAPMVYKADPAYPRSGLPVFDPRPVPPELQARGILYRPELSHSLVVFRKADPGSRRSPWRVVASDRIVVPNAAPAFILQVERAIFVKAETDVQFTSGLIRNISINKPSELLAAADLAVAAAQIVTSIPAQSLKIFNNRTENTIDLLSTNAQLIDTLRKYRADVNAGALPPAQAQAGFGDPLASAPRSAVGPDINPAGSRLEACLADPSVQQYPDPLRVCQGIVDRGL
jgi:hypothetical protein